MKMSNQLFFLILALSPGMMIPFSKRHECTIRQSIAKPLLFGPHCILVAAFGLLIYKAVSRYTIPPSLKFTMAPSWSYLGGILGGTYVLLIVICAPKLGIGNVTVLVLLGQILSAIVTGHFGWLQSPVHPINWQRMAGVVLLVAGICLVKKF